MSLFAEPRTVKSPEGCFFYHTMELPGFGVIRGDWDLRESFDEYVGGVELKGKRVLDVGTASGFLTFEAEKRGARVVSFDIADASSQALLPFKDKPYYADHKQWLIGQNRSYEPMKNAYWLAHRLYHSQAKVYYGNIYQLPESLGQFDVVLVGSVMEHLSDQVGALASISRLTGDLMVVNTTMLPTEDRIARFEPRADLSDRDYTWWVYSFGTYKEIFAMLGFSIQKILAVVCYAPFSETRQPRFTFVAKRVAAGQTPVPCELLAHPMPMRPKGAKQWVKHFIRQAVGLNRRVA